jgi:hypothetical protein
MSVQFVCKSVTPPLSRRSPTVASIRPVVKPFGRGPDPTRTADRRSGCELPSQVALAGWPRRRQVGHGGRRATLRIQHDGGSGVVRDARRPRPGAPGRLEVTPVGVRTRIANGPRAAALKVNARRTFLTVFQTRRAVEALAVVIATGVLCLGHDRHEQHRCQRDGAYPQVSNQHPCEHDLRPSVGLCFMSSHVPEWPCPIHRLESRER